jgi:hypothetical protein
MDRFLNWEVNYAKHLEMSSFCPPHIILGVGKYYDLGNRKCQTVGDAYAAKLLEAEPDWTHLAKAEPHLAPL